MPSTPTGATMSSRSTAEAEIARLAGLHPKAVDLSLERITRLLAALGDPQLRLPPVVHIAGTNGKGSAGAFARAMLEAAGLSVHVHTSPHLVRWHERYRLGAPGGGRLVEDEVLAETVRRVAAANGDKPITVFELLSAVMFVLFAEYPADAAIIEVGLGGRFDATNVIEQPAVSLIMPISLDHQAFLGDRVELIAAEKAGIIKPGVPAVIGFQESDAVRDVLVDAADRVGAPLWIYGQDYFAHEEHGRMVYQDTDGLLDLPLPRLPGRHQIANAAAAIRALRSGGFRIPEAAIEKAMTTVEWPARMQRLSRGRLVERAPQDAEIWLDGGHNPGAGTVIAEAIANLEEKNPRPLYLITGMINTKDPVGYFKAFEGIARQVFTVPIRSSDAGIDHEELADMAHAAGLAAEPVDSVVDALDAISRRSMPDEPVRILIGGSLYLAGDVLSDNETLPE